LAPPITTQHRDAILLLGHGSRDQRSNAEFEGLANCLRERWQPRELIHAYIELAQPSLSNALLPARNA
jgi:sirohydrochlorin ferrochelatase